ncbi:transcriptional regulator [Thiothrix eikelboomii]|uniref:transcriptional regulator n=1 Tax=Thiothrix eikelboomii TaxID=92487 RepID=UPI003BB16077
MIPVRASDYLMQRRRVTEMQWSRFISGSAKVRERVLRPDIYASWQRCALQLSPYSQAQAPISEAYLVQQRWQDSTLRAAAQREREQIMQLAREGSLVAALADMHGYLLWSFASAHMQARAEAVNFMAGSHWSEEASGTNAVGLCLKLGVATTVFASEHYLAFMHDWVGYASPIIHPQTGQMMGVLAISSTWNHHTPLGQAAVCELARAIAEHLPIWQPRAELELQALGTPKVIFRGQVQRISQRQLEILCLLALNPQGLTLDSFHAALYGDMPITISTLKAELSHLRRLLDGQIGSRPYRLLMPIWADFIDVWERLRSGRVTEAVELYRGSFLPQSTSPELEEWRYCVDAVMTRAVDACGDFSILLEKMRLGSRGSVLVRDRLAELLPEKTPS